MSQHDTLTPEQLDQHLDAILKAAGSALRHYTMQKSRDDMRAALRAALSATQPAQAAQSEPPIALHHFETEKARELQAAWIDGWESCQNSEFIGNEAMNDAFNRSNTLNDCLDLEQAAQGAGEAVASIYITPDGAREVDDWKHDLPVGRNILYTHPTPAQPAPVVPDNVMTSGPCAPDCHAWDGHECHNDMCPNPSALRWAEQVHFTNRESDMSVAARDVLAERQRQISQEGWAPDHDDQHDEEDLESAAACYALPNCKRKVGSSPFTPDMPTFWPWDRSWWKPGDRRRELVKACALLLAAIERRDRTATPTPPAQAEQQGEKA